MPRVVFTENLRRHVASEPREVEGSRVCDALAQVFSLHPGLRGYVLDDQGALRKHVTIFVDGVPVTDRIALTDPVPEDAEIYVMQALSGG